MADEVRAPLFTPQRWQQVRALLERLDALAPDARALELERIATDDAELVRMVQALLEDGAYGDERFGGAIARLLDPPCEPMPTLIGPFRPLRRLGEGGMGVVYLAERSESDFTQRVAVKLLDRGVAHAPRLAARERRILAALAHQNITAFVDAGTSDGRAWLAMEYVDGESLLAYCEQHGFDARARVRLFEQICAAVAYAHAQLVVHRDLKPSNVLVNGDGVAKLLDFGIAHVLDPNDEQTPATRVFTPEYASPEQLRGERVGTATDIYGLGLLLYELVTRRRLSVMDRASASARTWTPSELARCATRPDTAKGDAQAIDMQMMNRMLRGDLGRIIAHALEVDPAHRYVSAALLREDVVRWLDHRPLGIGRPGFAYVASRFVRRHRAVVAVAVISIAALLGLSGVAIWQAQRAGLMAMRAGQTKDFLASLFTDADPFNSKGGGKSNIELLKNAAQRIDREFADAPDQQIELREIVANALVRLGEPKVAHDLQKRDVEQTRQVYGAHSPQLGVALSGLAQTSEDTGDIDAARGSFTDAYALLQGTGDAWRKERMTAMSGLAKMENRGSHYAQAQRWYEQILHERQAKEGPESQDIAMDLFNLASCALYQEKYAQAEQFAQRAHAMLEHTLGAGHPRFIYVDLGLGSAQMKSGHVSAAIATLSNALKLARANLEPGTDMIGTIQLNLALARLYDRNDDDAIAAAKEARTIFTANKSPALGIAEMTLGRAQLHARQADAEQTLRESRVHLDANASRAPGAVGNSALAEAALGVAIARRGDAAEGERLARDARAKLVSAALDSSEKSASVDAYLGDILDLRKAPAAEARALRVEALAIDKHVLGPEHPVTRALAAELDD